MKEFWTMIKKKKNNKKIILYCKWEMKQKIINNCTEKRKNK